MKLTTWSKNCLTELFVRVLWNDTVASNNIANVFDHKISNIDIKILCVIIKRLHLLNVFRKNFITSFLYHLLHMRPSVTLNLLLRCNHEKLCTFTLVWVVCHVHLSCSSCYETLIILFCFFFIQFLLQWNVFVCGKVVLQKRRTNICCEQRALSLSNKYWRAK